MSTIKITPTSKPQQPSPGKEIKTPPPPVIKPPSQMPIPKQPPESRPTGSPPPPPIVPPKS